MNLSLLKCKIHRATVTNADLHYEGSISIDQSLCQEAGLIPFEKVDVYNCHNGARLTTYVIPGTKGEICLNGAAARLVMKGDPVIIVAYCEMEASLAHHHSPKVVFVNEKNEIIRPLSSSPNFHQDEIYV